MIIIGSNATTTTGTILEVAGNSLFRGTLTSYFNLTAPRFTATSSTASILPYASSTALTVSGTGYFGSASTTNLTISGAPGGILKTNAAGVVSVATAGSDYLNSTSGDWTGTLGGFTAPQLLASGFSTTSADVWKSSRNFFATTSSDYWKDQSSFFATTSTDYWLTQRTTDSLAEGATNKYWSNTLFDTRLAATTLLPNITTLSSLSLPASQLTNFGTPFFEYFSATTTTALSEGSNLYFTSSRADARINATSSIGTLTAAPNLGTVATSLSGFLKATAGVLSSALVDLASNATGLLPVANGGTGWSQIASGAVVLGNGTSQLATTSAGTNGQVLALVGGVPSWVATTTLANISGTLGVGSGGTGATTFSYGLLYSPGGTSAIANLATSSLNLLSTDIIEGSKLFYADARVQSFIHASSTIPKTYSDNSFTGSTIFSGSISALGSSQFANSSNFFGLTLTCPFSSDHA